MFTYKISFIALKDGIAFDMSSIHQENVEEFVNDILLVFAKADDQEKLVVESLQKNTEYIRKKINDLNEKYKEKLPQFNGVPAFFRKLAHDELFFFIPKITLDEMQRLKLHNYLRATSEDRPFEEIEKETLDLFGDLIKKYEIIAFGDYRKNIGESRKNERFCRFCKNTRVPLTFISKAHAISEALGNKTIVLYDECDGCNEHFSKTIEPEIIRYLSLFRTIFEVKGKGGPKEFKGENFDLKKEENIVLSFKSLDDRPEEFSMPYEVKLEAKDPITLQNIYKALCKYFLSVIDKKYLSDFDETIDWINNKIEIKTLPNIGEMISYHAFTLQPKLVTYIRKDEDYSLPYAVGEFYFTCKVFTFIIPLVKKDDKNFTSSEDFENFWNFFQHYKKSKGWVFMDYSNNKPRQFIMNLSFNLNKPSDDETDSS